MLQPKSPLSRVFIQLSLLLFLPLCMHATEWLYYYHVLFTICRSSGFTFTMCSASNVSRASMYRPGEFSLLRRFYFCFSPISLLLGCTCRILGNVRVLPSLSLFPLSSALGRGVRRRFACKGTVDIHVLLSHVYVIFFDRVASWNSSTSRGCWTRECR